jgi:hypothetical protein
MATIHRVREPEIGPFDTSDGTMDLAASDCAEIGRRGFTAILEGIVIPSYQQATAALLKGICLHLTMLTYIGYHSRERR